MTANGISLTGGAIAFGVGFIGGVVMMLQVYAALYTLPERLGRTAATFGFVGGIGSFAIYMVALAIRPYAGQIVGWISSPQQGTQFGFVGAASLIGLGLFYMRKRVRIAYGLTEIAVAMIGLSVYPVAPRGASNELAILTATWALGAMALVYIIVRGLDNVDVGLAARREHKKEQAVVGAPNGQ